MQPDSSSTTESSLTPRERAESLIFTLMETYQDQLFRYAFFRTNDRQIAIDIVQDTFTKVWVYLADGKTIANDEAFLYRVTKNAIIDFFKKKKSLSLEVVSASGFEPESSNEMHVKEKEGDIELVRGMLEELDEESKQIMFMRFSEERPIEEIAILFGKTTNAMTVKIHRIIQKLKSTYKTL